jgi:hypothetical protein
MTLQLLAVVVLGLMCGSELNVAGSTHSGYWRIRTIGGVRHLL